MGYSPWGRRVRQTEVTEHSHMLGGSIFSFSRNIHIVSILTAPVYTLTNIAQGFPLLRIIANTCYLLSF